MRPTEAQSPQRWTSWWLLLGVSLLAFSLYGFLLGRPALPNWPDYDDKLILNAYRGLDRGNIGFVRYLMLPHADHTWPLGRLFYWAVLKGLGLRWESLAPFLLASFAGAAVAPALGVWSVTRNAAVAWSLLVVFASSVLLATLATSISHYMMVYAASSLGIASLILTYSHSTTTNPRDEGRYRWLIGAAVVASYSIIGSGIVSVLVVAIAHPVLRLSSTLDEGFSFRRLVPLAKDLKLIGVLCAAVVLYVLMIGGGVYFFGNPVPGTTAYPEWENCTFRWGYVLDHYSYLSFGWLWPESIKDHTQPPFEGFSRLRLLWLLLMVGLAARGTTLMLKGGSASRRQLGGLLLSCVLISVASEAVSIAGRGPCQYWWIFRYGAYTAPPTALAVGLVLADYLSLMTAFKRRAVALALVALSSTYALHLRTVVTQSQDYRRGWTATRYQQNPGFSEAESRSNVSRP